MEDYSDYFQDPYTVYYDYCAIKAHFTTVSYDYTKRNGKINVNRKAFEKRGDKPFFMYLARHLNRSDNLPFFIAQFIESPYYIGEIVLEKTEAEQRYRSWSSRMDHLLKHYQLDLQTIKRLGYSWKTILSYKIGQHPPLFVLAYQRKITPETYVFIDRISDYIQKTSKALNEKFYTDLNLKFKKYSVFLPITTQKILSVTPKSLD